MSKKNKTNQAGELARKLKQEVRKNNLRLPLSVNTLGIASTPKTKQQFTELDK